jgi:hypothetical protein
VDTSTATTLAKSLKRLIYQEQFDLVDWKVDNSMLAVQSLAEALVVLTKITHFRMSCSSIPWRNTLPSASVIEVSGDVLSSP